jgi:hypothetical protein
MSGLSLRLALSFRLFLYHRHPGAIPLHVENGNRRADDDGKVQLHGSLDLLLLAALDIIADALGRSFHRFGGRLQARQDLHLLAAVIEGRLLAGQRVHAAHTRGNLGILNVQFDIGGELARVTVRA